MVGIKYCGGCNPVYNRARQVGFLKERFPEHEFQDALQGTTCDVWLVVCGCLRACASTEGLKAEKRLFILASENHFSEVVSYFEEERKKKTSDQESDATGIGEQREGSNKIHDRNPRKLRVGQEAVFCKSFFKDDVERFAALTGDVSRLHTDVEFAERTLYKRPVVHGVLAASLISTVMGTKLPGEGTIFIEEQVRFLKPVFYGDTITARVRFLSCLEGSKQYIGTFSGICENQRKEVVAIARCRQLMQKELFEVENPRDKVNALETEKI